MLSDDVEIKASKIQHLLMPHNSSSALQTINVHRFKLGFYCDSFDINDTRTHKLIDSLNE